MTNEANKAIDANSITIDGETVPFDAGQTIMDAALAVKIYIPHLCHYPGLTPAGNCRLCMVEANGKSVAACVTQAQSGQQVSSNTPELNAARLSITQMLFVEGNHICPSCEKSGNCRLQAMGYYLGMLEEHFHQFNPRREIDASHSTVLLDRDRCILCDLCVRASRDVDKKNVFAIAGRGIHARLIVNTASGKLGDSNIEAKDLAAKICPVGAILIRERSFDSPVAERIYDRQSISDTAMTEHVPRKEDDRG
ncbi:[NiFe] hydrogenase diaphorase moiety small subunit [Nitrosomonas marina]|uniref:[NiFe] hydrogenase diaphorase moiety small subunit n=1 Tax=Nitrosomonas marina TaxID=917 RepID=A0A1I0BR43_9PROT|nr:2Fe-2S iron-sulfur cluster-binding protein [Nitrosomonas marina]SET08801.1 [NiFe] hydrogenase diaphorase moiety small subunit [Nitrosomonas marina]